MQTVLSQTPLIFQLGYMKMVQLLTSLSLSDQRVCEYLTESVTLSWVWRCYFEFVWGQGCKLWKAHNRHSSGGPVAVVILHRLWRQNILCDSVTKILYPDIIIVWVGLVGFLIIHVFCVFHNGISWKICWYMEVYMYIVDRRIFLENVHSLKDLSQ